MHQLTHAVREDHKSVVAHIHTLSCVSRKRRITIQQHTKLCRAFQPVLKLQEARSPQFYSRSPQILRKIGLVWVPCNKISVLASVQNRICWLTAHANLCSKFKLSEKEGISHTATYSLSHFCASNASICSSHLSCYTIIWPTEWGLLVQKSLTNRIRTAGSKICGTNNQKRKDILLIGMIHSIHTICLTNRPTSESSHI